MGPPLPQEYKEGSIWGGGGPQLVTRNASFEIFYSLRCFLFSPPLNDFARLYGPWDKVYAPGFSEMPSSPY